MSASFPNAAFIANLSIIQQQHFYLTFWFHFYTFIENGCHNNVKIYNTFYRKNYVLFGAIAVNFWWYAITVSRCYIAISGTNMNYDKKKVVIFIIMHTFHMENLKRQKGSTKYILSELSFSLYSDTTLKLKVWQIGRCHPSFRHDFIANFGAGVWVSWVLWKIGKVEK